MIGATVFVFASVSEARPLLDTFDARPLRGNALKLYALENALLLISGVGTTATAAAIDTLAATYRPRRVVLGGIAARLHDGLPVGGIAQVAVAAFESAQRTVYVPVSCSASNELRGARGDCTLLSRSALRLDTAERTRLAGVADLVDRDGVTVASACLQHGIECAIFKAVGEYAGARALSAGMTAELDTRLAAFLLDHYRSLVVDAEVTDTRRVKVGGTA